MSKRRKSSSNNRPVDKALVNVIKATVGASQVSTQIVNLGFPCTILGLRWDLTFIQDAGTGNCFGSWAIVISRDGQLLSNIDNTTDAATYYEPEQDVMSFGWWQIENNVETIMARGETKTMRKLKVGDTLQFIALGAATNTTTIRGTVQIFCKS